MEKISDSNKKKINDNLIKCSIAKNFDDACNEWYSTDIKHKNSENDHHPCACGKNKGIKNLNLIINGKNGHTLWVGGTCKGYIGNLNENEIKKKINN